MCQWLGTDPEGESWLRGRALKVEIRAVGSESCCAEVFDMASTDVELDMSRWRTMWKVVARNYRYRSKSLGAGGHRESIHIQCVDSSLLHNPLEVVIKQTGFARDVKTNENGYCGPEATRAEVSQRLMTIATVDHLQPQSTGITIIQKYQSRGKFEQRSSLLLLRVPIIYEIMSCYVILRPQPLSGRLRRRLVPKLDLHQDLANFNGYPSISYT